MDRFVTRQKRDLPGDAYKPPPLEESSNLSANGDLFDDDEGTVELTSVTTPAAKKPRVSSRRTGMKSAKTFMDPVHGRIDLPGAAVELIDTPQFQRLRKLKQLGVAYSVFPGACHNRFEHSLGVCYLAGHHLELLCRNQPNLKVTPRDKLCVQIAGLLHDLGHGPFSHVFDGAFLPGNGVEWNHEEGSVMMIKHLIESNHIDLSKYGLNPAEDMEFIFKLIEGTPANEAKLLDETDGWLRQRFLYYIVSNNESGLDVDKLDYYQRDCYYTGISMRNVYDNLLDASMVVKCTDGASRICYPEKYVEDVFHAFSTRIALHLKVYQHRAVISIEKALIDVLMEAEKYLRVVGKDGALLRLTEVVHDPVAFTRVNDSIIDLIWQSPDPRLNKARKLLTAMENRQLYHCCGEITVPADDSPGDLERMFRLQTPPSAESIKNEIYTYAQDYDADLVENDGLIIQIMKAHYGKKEQNPVNFVYFFKKKAELSNEPAKLINCRDIMPAMLPQVFMDIRIRVFCKNARHRQAATKAFAEWCEQSGAGEPMMSQSQVMD